MLLRFLVLLIPRFNFTLAETPLDDPRVVIYQFDLVME